MNPDPWILNSELLIRILQSHINADPDPEHCILSSFEELQGERSYESFGIRVRLAAGYGSAPQNSVVSLRLLLCTFCIMH
jgi:hypothetical protein